MNLPLSLRNVSVTCRAGNVWVKLWSYSWGTTFGAVNATNGTWAVDDMILTHGQHSIIVPDIEGMSAIVLPVDYI